MAIAHVLNKEAVIMIPIAVDFVSKAIILSQPLTHRIKVLCLILNLISFTGFLLLRLVFPITPQTEVLGIVSTLFCGILLLREHTLIGRLFMPYTRTRDDVIIV